MDSFSDEVCKELRHYVYRLVDPRDGSTFYVGRGQKNRVFNHAKAKLEGEPADGLPLRLEVIRAIKSAASGLEPIHVIHRHGMDDATAAEVEAALIDAYPGLTNIQPGAGSGDFGPAHVIQLANKYGAEVMVLNHDNLLIVKIRPDEVTKNNGNVYETVRASWVLNRDRAQKVQYVLAVVHGVCKGVYVPDRWDEVRWDDPAKKPRLAFCGHEAPKEIQERYLNKRIPESMSKRGAANPVQYHNC